VDATVSNLINIVLTPGHSNPKISAIEILPLQADVELNRTVVELNPGTSFQFQAVVAGRLIRMLFGQSART